MANNTAEMSTIQYLNTFNRFSEELTELYHEFARKKGLSDSALSVLYALYERDGQRQLELCKTSLMPKQTLASALKRLKEQGLVRTESESRRVSRVFLTKEGQQQAKMVIGPLLKAEEAALETLPPALLEQLPQVLSRYHSTLKAELEAI